MSIETQTPQPNDMNLDAGARELLLPAVAPTPSEAPVAPVEAPESRITYLPPTPAPDQKPFAGRTRRVLVTAGGGNPLASHLR